MGTASGIVFFVRALLSNRAAIAAENRVLRQRLAVLQRSTKHLKWTCRTSRSGKPSSCRSWSQPLLGVRCDYKHVLPHRSESGGV